MGRPADHQKPQSGEHVSPGIPTRGWGLFSVANGWAGVGLRFAPSLHTVRLPTIETKFIGWFCNSRFPLGFSALWCPLKKITKVFDDMHDLVMLNPKST